MTQTVTRDEMKLSLLTTTMDLTLYRLLLWLLLLLSFALPDITSADIDSDIDDTATTSSSSSSSSSSIHDFEIIPTNSVQAIKAAEYAVHELSKLSDSDIYESLRLKTITHCSLNDGIFHYNTLLTLQLESPYFKSGKAVEEFKMIVMLHKEDKVKTLAIDEFPVMDEDVIEEHYIRKIDRKRREREEAFRRLEVEAYLDYDYGRSDSSSEPRFVIDSMISTDSLREGGHTIQDLLLALDTQDMLKGRMKDSERNIQHRLGGEQLQEEQQLVRYSLKELYEVVTEQVSATDYQRFRARSLLDVAMSSLPSSSNR